MAAAGEGSRHGRPTNGRTANRGERNGRARIGISGWRYSSWRGDFYPRGLRQRDELSYAAARFGSIELNGSFYGLQRPERYVGWREATPDDFVFAVKGGRFITHMRRLREPRQALANFFASGVLALEHKLGPILWQLPADLSFDPDVLDAFCRELPMTTSAAARLARHHDEKLDGRAFTRATTDRPMVHAMEVRNETYRSADCYDILRSHGVVLVVSDGADRWPMMRELTADTVYVRLHGHTRLYESNYSAQALGSWARRIRGWTSGTAAPDGQPRNVYVYFDNDAHGYAPHNAQSLQSIVRRWSQKSTSSAPGTR